MTRLLRALAAGLLLLAVTGACGGAEDPPAAASTPAPTGPVDDRTRAAYTELMTNLDERFAHLADDLGTARRRGDDDAVRHAAAYLRETVVELTAVLRALELEPVRPWVDDAVATAESIADGLADVARVGSGLAALVSIEQQPLDRLHAELTALGAAIDLSRGTSSP